MSDINAQLQDILAQLQSLTERVALIEARQMLVPDIERYGKLQQFLAEGNFREADAETLRVILEAAGRTRDTLTPEDMMRFPVNVIRVLDRLWKNYSGDHFGFSNQVKLYFAAGGDINTLRTQDAETIRKFGELVGWRDKDEWRIDDYDHWDFSLAAPEGCFPALWWKSPYGLKMVTFCFTRLIECDLQAMKGIIGYFHALLSPQFAPTGIKVAVVVGTILLTINHGYAIMSGRMTSDRQLAASLTYLVPYLVNVHGQYSSYRRQQWPKKSQE